MQKLNIRKFIGILDIDLSDMPIFLRIFGMNINKTNRTYERKNLDIILEIWYNIIVEINKNINSQKSSRSGEIDFME